VTTAPPSPPRVGGPSDPSHSADPSDPTSSCDPTGSHTDASGPEPAPHEAARPGRRLRYVVVGLVLAGSLGFLLAKGLGTSLDFYLPADQAVHQAASLGGRTFNLEGVVEPGSVHPTAKGVDFVVTSGATAVQVVNSGSPPELFQASIPIIAVGHFSGTTFVSDQILVKHTSDYVAAHPGRVTAPDGTKR
jgi:cytochrome c-type biogenesis protein CcmE